MKLCICMKFWMDFLKGVIARRIYQLTIECIIYHSSFTKLRSFISFGLTWGGNALKHQAFTPLWS